MIRRALLLAITALLVDLVLLSFWPVVKAAVASPRTLIGLAMPQFWLPLVSPVTLILFLAAFYQELTGYAGPSARQVWALAAASGMAVGIAFRAWQLHAGAVALNALSPQIRAQLSPGALDVRGQWVQAIYRSFIPSVIWIGFLLVFWRDDAPLGRKWTRGLAFVLCLVTTAQAVNQFARTLYRLPRHLADWPGRPVFTFWNLAILPAVFLAASAALPFFLFSVWRTRSISDSGPGTATL